MRDPAFEFDLIKKLESFYEQKLANNPDYLFNDRTEGFVSIGKAHEDHLGHHTITITVTAFKGGTIRRNLYLPVGEVTNADYYLEVIRRFFSQRGFVDPNQSLSPNSFNRMLEAELAKLRTEHPDLLRTVPEHTEIPPNIIGIFRPQIIYPPKKDLTNRSIVLKFEIRPASDYVNVGTQYLADPIDLQISTRTHDISHVESLLESAKQKFTELGLLEYDLGNIAQENRGEKEIPYDWIDLEDIRLYKKPNDKFYSLQIVRAVEGKTRITLSLRTRDVAKAEEIRDLVKGSLIPMYALNGERYGEPITLNAISEFIEEHIPKEPKTPGERGRSDHRIVNVNGVDRIKLFTPVLNSAERDDGAVYHGFVLKIAPVNIRTSSINSCVSGNLNTSNSILANQRLRTLQNLTEIALEEYFTANPAMEIPAYTESITRRYGEPNNKTYTFPITKFRIRALGETTQENAIFFDDLREQVIKPALEDFDRYISWNSAIEKTSEQRWKATFQVLRNQGEPYPPDISMFSGPFTVSADSKEKLEAFTHTLEIELLRRQQYFSRERPVEQFGEPSANVVIRESLAAALRAHVENINLEGNNLLTSLLTRVIGPRL